MRALSKENVTANFKIFRPASTIITILCCTETDTAANARLNNWEHIQAGETMFSTRE
jgi:hypothetical protein